MPYNFYEESTTAIQVKTVSVYLTKENVEAIRKDAFLVNEGYTVEYIIKKDKSKLFLNYLTGWASATGILDA